MSTVKIGRTPVMIGVLGLLAILVYLDQFSSGSGGGGGAGDAGKRLPTAGVSKTGLPKAGARPGSGGATGTVNPLSVVRVQELTETLARPLFEPGRRSLERAPVAVAPPPPPPPPRPQQAPVEEPRYRLVGVVMGDKDAIALLTQGDSRPIRVEPGDIVQGWQVVKIEPTEVTLSRSGRQFIVRMTKR